MIYINDAIIKMDNERNYILMEVMYSTSPDCKLVFYCPRKHQKFDWTEM